MKGYGSFCPVAKAAEILGERWTLLVLRELLLGSTRFNDFRRGIPQMSPSLLSKRLQELEAAGLVRRKAGEVERQHVYLPTEACEELRPLLVSIGIWGQRWVRSKLTRDELDPGMLMWYVHRHFVADKLPERRVVIHLEFTDAPRMKNWWVVLEDGDADLCLEDPGHPVDVEMLVDLLTLTRVYIGDTSFDAARASGKLIIEGPRTLTRNMSHWFARSRFADVEDARTPTGTHAA